MELLVAASLWSGIVTLLAAFSGAVDVAWAFGCIWAGIALIICIAWGSNL